jgi:cell division protein FtsQ
MNFTKGLKKKIGKSPLSSWEKKGKSSSQSPTFTKQSYTPFKHNSSQQSSLVKKGAKKTASFFSRLGKSNPVGKTPRKTDYRGAVFTLCLILIGVGVLLYSDRSWIEGFCSKVEYFEVGDNVVIEGCHVTTPAEIRELAEIRYHTNLFSVNPGRLAAILVKHPWVRDAHIHRDWPNKLVIDIVEYVPEALAVSGASGQQKLYYMDADGVPFIPVQPGQDLDYPVITGMEKMKLPDKRRQALHEAMQFIRLVKRNNPNLPAQSISEIHLDQTEGMVVYLVEYPFPIYFGLGDVTKKYKQLEDVLGVLYKQRKDGMLISQVEYIRMDYSENKVLVAQSGSS